MRVILERAVTQLRKQLLGVGALVEDALEKAVRAVDRRDRVLARMVVDADNEVDRREVEIEEECLKILALHQPVAADLRYIVSVLRIDNDLERIGDLAVSIARRAEGLCDLPEISGVRFDFAPFAARVHEMLRKSLESFVEVDSTLAQRVLDADDEVDAMNREMHQMITRELKRHPEAIDQLLLLLSISKHLERIADHSTNIAEDVIYMVSGEIVRHR
jgi:phosphate transport system protein